MLRLHFVHTTLSTWIVVQSSLFIGSVFGDHSVLVQPELGIVAILAGLAHVLFMYVALSNKTNEDGGIRVNPYLSLLEWFPARGISGLRCASDVLAQFWGSALALLVSWLILGDTANFLSGVGGGSPTHIGSGWAFLLKVLASSFISRVYFQHRSNVQQPFFMAYVVSAQVTLVYAFVGVTTQNPLRWLAACILEDSCGADGWWIYPFAPALGFPIGWLYNKMESA